MRKIIQLLVIVQLAVLLTGCCCPCGKKPATEPSQPQEAPNESSKADQ